MSELVEYSAPALVENGRRRWVALMQPAAELASSIAGTEFVPGAIRNNPAAIAACVLYGDEVGLGPMQSLSKIHVVDGRPGLSAEAMRSLILAAGHELWIEEQTLSKVMIAGRRRESSQVSRIAWTLDDARRAGIAGKQNWQRYPRQMLAARATAELARLIFADVIGGLALVDELEDGAPIEPRPEDTRSASVGTGRRRREATSLGRPSPPPDADAHEEPPLPDDEAPRQEADTGSPSWRRMHAMFREAGFEERTRRIAYASEVVQRPLSSTKDLSGPEIALVLNALSDTLANAQASAMNEPDVAFGSPETSAQDLEGLAAPLSLAMFRARAAGEGFSQLDVARVGGQLFPGGSLNELDEAGLARLLDALLEEREEHEREEES